MASIDIILLGYYTLLIVSVALALVAVSLHQKLKKANTLLTQLKKLILMRRSNR